MIDPAYVLVNGVELKEVEQKVNDLMAKGYIPQPMVITVAHPTTKPRYVVPMVAWIPPAELGEAFAQGAIAGILESHGTVIAILERLKGLA